MKRLATRTRNFAHNGNVIVILSRRRLLRQIA